MNLDKLKVGDTVIVRTERYGGPYDILGVIRKIYPREDIALIDQTHYGADTGIYTSKHIIKKAKKSASAMEFDIQQKIIHCANLIINQAADIASIYDGEEMEIKFKVDSSPKLKDYIITAQKHLD